MFDIRASTSLACRRAVSKHSFTCFVLLCLTVQKFGSMAPIVMANNLISAVRVEIRAALRLKMLNPTCRLMAPD